MIGRLIIFTFVVGFFGVASAILGFIAEATRLKRHDIRVSKGDCLYPANASPALGICAILLLVVAQITVSVVTGCCGCCRPRGGISSSKCRRFVGTISSVFSWIAAVLAVLFFLQGAVGNLPVTVVEGQECHYVRGGVFTVAAVLSLVATVLGIFSYIVLFAGATVAAGGHKPHAAGEIPMGQPAQGYGQGQPPYANMPPAQGYGQYPPTAPAQHGPAAV